MNKIKAKTNRAKKMVKVGKANLSERNAIKLDLLARRLSMDSERRYGSYVSSKHIKESLAEIMLFRNNIRTIKKKFLTDKMTRQEALSKLSNMKYKLGDVSRASVEGGFSGRVATFEQKEIMQAIRFVKTGNKKYDSADKIPLIFKMF